jgi:flagellar biosynthesis protein FlhG
LSVTVVDGDMGLANLDLLLGLTPPMTLENFFRDGASLEEIAIDGPRGVRLIAGGAGIPELTRLTAEQLDRFAAGLADLARTSEIVLLDTSAGIGDDAARLWRIADRFLLVTWPEPAALVDAYAALKVLHRGGPAPEVALVINGVADAGEAEEVHCRLQTAARRFLDQDVALDGFIVRDESMADAARRQQAVVQLHPLSPASRCFERLALHLVALARGAMRAGAEKSWTRTWRAGEVLH